MCGGSSFIIEVVSEKLVLATGGGAPPTAPSSDMAGSLPTAGELRTKPGDDGVPTSSNTQHNTTCQYMTLWEMAFSTAWSPRFSGVAAQ